MFDTGKFLRDRYEDLLGKEFKLDVSFVVQISRYNW